MNTEAQTHHVFRLSSFKKTRHISVTERCVCVCGRVVEGGGGTSPTRSPLWAGCTERKKWHNLRNQVKREGEYEDCSLRGLQQAVRSGEGRSAGRLQVYDGCSHSAKRNASVSNAACVETHLRGVEGTKSLQFWFSYHRANTAGGFDRVLICYGCQEFVILEKKTNDLLNDAPTGDLASMKLCWMLEIPLKPH